MKKWDDSVKMFVLDEDCQKFEEIFEMPVVDNYATLSRLGWLGLSNRAYHISEGGENWSRNFRRFCRFLHEEMGRQQFFVDYIPLPEGK